MAHPKDERTFRRVSKNPRFQDTRGAYYLHVAGKSQLLPERMEKQRITRSHGIRDQKNGRLRRLHLPVAYPRSDLASLRYPSPQRFWITGRLQPLYHTCRLFQGRLDTLSAKR